MAELEKEQHTVALEKERRQKEKIQKQREEKERKEKEKAEKEKNKLWENTHMAELKEQEEYRKEQILVEAKEEERKNESITGYNGEVVDGLTQAEREWQEHLQMQEQLKQQWEMGRE